MTGFRESEQITMCDWINPNIVVPFAMYECTGYYDKNRPSWSDMKKFALHIDAGNPKPAGFKVPGTGFATSVRLVAAEADDEDDD